MASVPVGDTWSKVELSISCANLVDLDTFSKSDPVVFVYIAEGQTWHKLGRTEIIWNNLNPKFSKTFTVDYNFEEIQKLKFVVHDVDNESHIENESKQELIGIMECTLGEIVAAGQQFSKALKLPGDHKSRGTIMIRAEETTDSKFKVTMELSAIKLDKKDLFGLSDPFVEISKAQEDSSFTLVYRSDAIKKSLNPRWLAFSMPSQTLCSGDLDRTLKFSVWDWNRSGSHEFIGACTTSLRAICPEKGGSIFNLDLINPDKKAKKKSYVNSGRLVFNSVRITPIYTFLDYIRGGCNINLIIAVDFTASNGDPMTPSSLHFNNPYQENEYIQAIRSVASVLAPYDNDQMIPAFGFGAKLPPHWEISHCFPLNFNYERPEVYGVQGILDAYQFTLCRMKLHGPTNFSSFLDKTIQYAIGGITQNSQDYYILLVITDGVISDMNQTIDRIVAASKLPLSIVIVGVGAADFTNMEILDADETPLRNSKGELMSRDIVQFVPFRQFCNKGGSNASLARETLAEIPGQVTTFMSMSGIKPNPARVATPSELSQTSPAPYPQTPYPPASYPPPPYPSK